MSNRRFTIGRWGPADLRLWEARMGFGHGQTGEAAAALGMSYDGYRAKRRGRVAITTQDQALALLTWEFRELQRRAVKLLEGLGAPPLMVSQFWDIGQEHTLFAEKLGKLATAEAGQPPA